MGGGATTCTLDVQNHASQIYWRDPFSMTYGAEAVIPLETGFPTSRTSSFNPKDNDEQLAKSLDLIEEKRENAMVQLAHYQQKLKQRYDANVKLRPLNPGDLVLRKVVGTAKNPTWGKLGPNWEGPYRITSKAGIGAYFLEDLDEHVIPRSWNVNHLKRFTIDMYFHDQFICYSYSVYTIYLLVLLSA